jgi:hypothetical protein
MKERTKSGLKAKAPAAGHSRSAHPKNDGCVPKLRKLMICELLRDLDERIPTACN